MFHKEEQKLFSQLYGKGNNMSFNALFTKRIKNMKTKLVLIKNDSDDTKNWSKVLIKQVCQ